MPRQPKQETAVAKIAALKSLDGFASLDSYRNAVSAALPRGMKVSEKFWFELEATIDTFLLWERRRLRHPPLAERARWQRIENLTSALTKELREADRQTLRSYSNPNWAKPALKELGRLRPRAHAHVGHIARLPKGTVAGVTIAGNSSTPVF